MGRIRIYTIAWVPTRKGEASVEDVDCWGGHYTTYRFTCRVAAQRMADTLNRETWGAMGHYTPVDTTTPTRRSA